MEILLIEPYHTGSHAAWADGLVRHSRHTVRVLVAARLLLEMADVGGAVALARLFRAGDYRPDLILATDMLDCPPSWPSRAVGRGAFPPRCTSTKTS